MNAGVVRRTATMRRLRPLFLLFVVDAACAAAPTQTAVSIRETPSAGGGGTVGGWFARAAKLEAISIPAFERLARELAHHGADPELVRAAHRARRDEVRHAAAMRTLAREAGEREANLVAPDVGELPVRSVFAIALENAVEGCLLETFAALVATHQARHATSYRVRRKMDAIANDETRHAELAWAVDAWCRARLTTEENAALDRAREAAIVGLKTAIASAAPAPLCLGAPDPVTSARLVDSMLNALS